MNFTRAAERAWARHVVNLATDPSTSPKVTRTQAMEALLILARDAT